MRLGRRLPRRFFARSSTEVAPDLLGRILVRTLPGGERLVVRLVEVEAYGPNDPASHAFRGPTPRNLVMFGPPGHLYVYFTYGMHFCSNVVTGGRGEGSAVLLRAAEPLEGLGVMRAHRRVEAVRLLCSGPGRLTQALAIDRAQDGADLLARGDVELLAGEPVPAARIARSARVGVRVAAERPWRYYVGGSRFVSPGRPANAGASRTVRGSRRS